MITPTISATAPTVDDSVAISLYSDALIDDGVVTNFNPGWGQSGSLAPATDAGTDAGNVLKFTNLNYQGIELNTTDVSALESVHLDLWSADTGIVRFYLVSNNGEVSENGINLEVTGDEWNSFDIDLDVFGGVDLTSVFQMKFDSQSTVIGSEDGLTNFYMDNLYFSNNPPVDYGEHILSLIANVGGEIMFLDDLTETITATSHTIEYDGTVYNYSDVDEIITTVVRDGEFTTEYAVEIAESFPDFAGITYDEAIDLVGQPNMVETLLMVAGFDGNYVG